MTTYLEGGSGETDWAHEGREGDGGGEPEQGKVVVVHCFHVPGGDFSENLRN